MTSNTKYLKKKLQLLVKILETPVKIHVAILMSVLFTDDLIQYKTKNESNSNKQD